MACLPYDMLNIFDMTSDKPVPAIQLTGLGSTAENVSEIFSNQVSRKSRLPQQSSETASAEGLLRIP